jgi:hypothetical protein
MSFLSGNITFAEQETGRPWQVVHIAEAPSSAALITYANSLLTYSAARLVNVTFIETFLIDHTGTYTDWKDVTKKARINLRRSPLSSTQSENYRAIVIPAPHLSMFTDGIVKKTIGDEIAALYTTFRGISGVSFVFAHGALSDD